MSCRSAVELAERAAEIERLSARFEALRCAALAAACDAVEGPGAFKALGFRHAIDLVAETSKADPRSLRVLAKLGHWLVEFPGFAHAFAGGVLTGRHVRELHKLDNHRVHHQLIESQEMLVNAARDCDFSDFVNVLAYWLNASDVCRRQTRPRAAHSRTRTLMASSLLSRRPERRVPTGSIPTDR